MFTHILPLSLLVLVARAAMTPTAPGPGDVFSAGSVCSLSWEPDTTGLWKNVTIQLMSGQNLVMLPVTTVVTGLDGTDGSLSPYNWTCPDVDPYSAIYFYQFTQDGADSPAWTTRFTIASANGTTVPPEHATPPSGDDIPWGIGHIALSSPANSTGFNLNTNSTTSNNSTLSLPTASPIQSGFVKAVRPTATTVATWLVLPIPSDGATSVDGRNAMAAMMNGAHRRGGSIGLGAAMIAVVLYVLVLGISYT